MSYKKKNMILWGGTFLFLLLSWNLAFEETLDLSQKIESIQKQLSNIDRAPREIAELESELKQMQGNTKMLYSSVLEMRESLLHEISELSNKYDVSLKRFPEYYIQDKESFELTTSPIVLQGDFKDLIRLMDEFEKKNTSGKVSSAYFNIEESPRTGKRSLFLTLYIQSINV